MLKLKQTLDGSGKIFSPPILAQKFGLTLVAYLNAAVGNSEFYGVIMLILQDQLFG